MPSFLAATLSATEEALREIGASFAVIGGIAVSARVNPRFTQDIDFAIAVEDDAHAEAISGALIRRGYRVSAEIDQLAQDRLATLRMIPPYRGSGDAEFLEQPFVDLLFASSGIEPEIVAGADAVEVLSGVVVPTARIPHLIAMKVLSESDERIKDRDDLGKLIHAASATGLEEARVLLQLVEQRGFARGKDLQQALSRFLKMR